MGTSCRPAAGGYFMELMVENTPAPYWLHSFDELGDAQEIRAAREMMKRLVVRSDGANITESYSHPPILLW
jgi:hypothetical protein